MAQELTKAFYRTREVEKITGVPYSTLHDWIQHGDLKTSGRFGMRPKSPYKISADEVRRILDTVSEQ